MLQLSFRRLWLRLVEHLDGPLLLITSGLMLAGLVTVYSATYDANNRTLNQLINMLVGLGVMFRPHLVHHIADSKSGAKTLIEPQPLRNLHFKPQHLDTIKKAMIGVNTEGTGARAFAGAGYESGGKTGTAQVFSLKGEEYKEGKVKKELRDHALFIAFAPADKPKIAVAVLVENGGFGAQAAAPIARMVFDYYLLGKLPAGPAREVEAEGVEE